ncbi:DUF5133 domain-containing protein [Streptomyces sp. DH37]|uniref:DUF5133 domain-containing protein n=1 Tax=Streptomyces sp. DH37 TaxID=3040122 RepID=UPI002441025E|nr:DUF5133 domain-containing protein [Streptomyces sp. DH37]MDG9701492.1 DUF5133 domain-containing protein [Streptomyces sp. DH37]
MLMAHPAVLRELVQRYEALRSQAVQGTGGAEVRQRMEDAAYTLCVSTGTREVGAALTEARRRMSGARGRDDLALVSG